MARRRPVLSAQSDEIATRLENKLDGHLRILKLCIGGQTAVFLAALAAFVFALHR